MEDVVLVCGNDKLLSWQAHPLRKVSREDITEVAGGDDETNGGGGVLLDEIEVGVEVVRYLGEDARPVDGVYGGEAVGLVDFGVCEEGFYEVLDEVSANTWCACKVLYVPDNHRKSHQPPNCVRWRPARWSFGPPV